MKLFVRTLKSLKYWKMREKKILQKATFETWDFRNKSQVFQQPHQSKLLENTFHS